MPAPTAGTLAAKIYARWLPIQRGDAQAGYPLGALAESIAGPVQPLEDIVTDSASHPAWGLAWDAANAPLWVLPWIALNVGVEWHGEPTETLRTQILELPQFRAGTTASQVAAAQQTLTGGKRVTVTERYLGNFWKQLFVTYSAETPDTAATETAILSRKAAGKVLTYRTDPGWSVDAFEATYSGRTVGDAETDFASVTSFETRLPGPSVFNLEAETVATLESAFLNVNEVETRLP